MAASLACGGGPRTWSGARDHDGYMEYRIVYRVVCLALDGPNTAMTAPGLPVPGDIWVVDNDIDITAVCLPDLTIIPVHQIGEPNEYFDLEYIFSNKPSGKCYNDYGTGTGNVAKNPLLERDRISGGFSKFQKEQVYDRFDERIANSSFEQIRGPLAEFDENRATVRIEQNVADLTWSTLQTMIDTVNDATLWGKAARTIKLSNITWDRRYTQDCTCYFVRTLEFEHNKDGFDRDIVDEGTKALNGQWDDATGLWVLKNIAGGAPDPANPAHYCRIQDRFGNIMRVTLNGAGLPAISSADAGTITVEKYEESNFLTLGIPTVMADCNG